MARARPGGKWGVRVPGPGDALQWACATMPVRPLVVVRAEPGGAGRAPVVAAARVAPARAIPIEAHVPSHAWSPRALREGEGVRAVQDGWILPVLGTRDARLDGGDGGRSQWRLRGLTDGAREGGGLVRRMQAARLRGTWTGSAGAWERLRREAAGAGEIADARGRWAVRSIREVRRVPGRGRLLEARVQWEGLGPDGGP